MRRFGLISAVVTAVVLGGADGARGVEVVVVGKLVDYACYTTLGQQQGTSDNHSKCAVACAQKGHRLALVTPIGAVFKVTGVLTQNNNARLVPLMNQMVAMTGAVTWEAVVEPALVPLSDAPLADLRRGDLQDLVKSIDVRRGNVREGDVRAPHPLNIEATSVELAKNLPKP